MVKSYIESLSSLQRVGAKPAAIVLHSYASGTARQLALKAQVKLSKAGFPVYTSIERAGNAISKFIRYHQWHQEKSEDD